MTVCRPGICIGGVTPPRPYNKNDTPSYNSLTDRVCTERLEIFTVCMDGR